MLLDQLSTPALLVERTRLLRNIQVMQARADAQQVRLRPHTKTHKSIKLARWQVQEGASGITVAKPSEAEVFAEAGFQDICIAYTLVTSYHFERVLRLMQQGIQVSFCVDTLEGARAASAFFADHRMPARVLVEVDVGYGRCGVRWDDPESVHFIRHVQQLPGLELVGLLTHAGHSYHGPRDASETEEEALRRVSAEERDHMLALAVALSEAGVVFPEQPFTLSIGSTPSMRFFENREWHGWRITEIRPGNYVFYDATQVGLKVASLEQCALTVWTSIISRHPGEQGYRYYLDAGKKIFTTDRGYGTRGYGIILKHSQRMEPLPGVEIVALSEEHGWVHAVGEAPLQVRDRIRVVPNHACVVVNTQDILYLVDGPDVIETWQVDARGCVW